MQGEKGEDRKRKRIFFNFIVPITPHVPLASQLALSELYNKDHQKASVEKSSSKQDSKYDLGALLFLLVIT